uniref:Putative capsid protein n=1 Tax=viral metagenome TaxID=1070528 RepID=A0A6M3JWI7_9ZZZZ
MAWTLSELSKIETDPLRKSVIDGLLMESDLMGFVPWETIGTLSTSVVRYKDLPSFGYRKVNAGFDESTGTFEQKVETISLGGLDIDTDKAIARAKNTIADARAVQQTMALKSAAYQFNWKFIAGNPVNDPEEFKGLTERVNDINNEGYTDQLFLTSVTAGEGILYSSANSQNFLNDVDKLIYAIDGHNPDYLLMNKKLLLALRALLRKEKMLNQAQDQFGRLIDMYGNTKLVDIGVRADQSTEIILNTETAAGAVTGGTECTSMYAVKFGIGDELWGIQEYPMEVTDLGELQTAPKYRTRIDWPHGLAMVSPRCIARMYGIIPDSSA